MFVPQAAEFEKRQVSVDVDGVVGPNQAISW
jgi:hypothetical protein